MNTSDTRSLPTTTASSSPSTPAGASGARITRRLLITATATAGVCGAAAVATPIVVPYIEDRLKQAALAAALGELQQIEGVSIEAALRAAEITRAAVSAIVLPVARLVAALGDAALNALLIALGAAHNALAFINASTTEVDALRVVVASWQTGITALPITLASYLNADITSGESYLRALRTMMAKYGSSSSTASL